jgi:hypothetical protein
LGAEALGGASGNNIGNYNTAVGRGALENNVSGERNTALGFDALSNNIKGNLNTAIGDFTLVQMTRGSENTAVGREALANLGTPPTEGNTNNDDNYYAGRGNTAIGHQAGENLGEIASNNNNIRNANNYNTFLGSHTNVSESGNKYEMSTAVGAYAQITDSKQIVLGGADTNVLVPGLLNFNLNSNSIFTDPNNKTYLLVKVGKIQYSLEMSEVSEVSE